MFNVLVLPVGLGLLGFIEPCSIGSTLVFIKLMEGRSPGEKLWQLVCFAGTRALLIGILGLVAAVIGAVFFGVQRGMWLALAAVYFAIGAAFLSGRAAWLMRSFGPGLSRLADARGAAAIGAFFGLNIPACAAPLLAALLGAAAAGGASGMAFLAGFASLSLFGLALSAPLFAAVLSPAAARALDRLAGLSRRAPLATGLVFVALGLWSAWFAVTVSLEATS